MHGIHQPERVAVLRQEFLPQTQEHLTKHLAGEETFEEPLGPFRGEQRRCLAFGPHDAACPFDMK